MYFYVFWELFSFYVKWEFNVLLCFLGINLFLCYLHLCHLGNHQENEIESMFSNNSVFGRTFTQASD